MTEPQLFEQLQQVAAGRHAADSLADLMYEWERSGVGVEAVKPILLFLEQHPDVDTGMPGELVHFVERFYGAGYEKELLSSVERMPTLRTVWMVNRILNGTRSPDARKVLVEALRRVKLHSSVTDGVVALVDRFLDKQH